MQSDYYDKIKVRDKKIRISEKTMSNKKGRIYYMVMPDFSWDNIINALEKIDRMDPRNLNKGTKFELLYQGKRYPPKEVLRYANLELSGEILQNHSGGDETNDALIKLGFSVVLLGTHTAIGLRYTAKKRIGNIDESDLFEINCNFIRDINHDKLNHTDREILAKARVGQSIFKKGLLKQSSSCLLCGIAYEPLLIASHIKPWKDASDLERLDLNNGILLCPNHDAMFDKGYITFSEKGTLIISNQLNEITRTLINLQEGIKVKLNDDQLKYMTWHRRYYFKGK